MTAVRLARGFTKRDYIVKFTGHYHGHADHFLIQAGSGVAGINTTSSSAGIPEDIIKHTLCLPFNNIEAAHALLTAADKKNKIAAVILEPIACNMGVVSASYDFIHELHKMTKSIGALLIFDEVITGFRIGLGGAQEYYNIQPDLTCLGKIIGGGFPAAAFGGKREIMDLLAPLGPVYQAGTLSGNPVAMEAGLQSLKLLEASRFYEELERKANLITKPVHDYIQQHALPASMQQAGSLFTLFFGLSKIDNFEQAQHLDQEKFARFFRYMFAEGIYVPPSQYEAWFVSAAHTDEHLKKTCAAVLNFLKQTF
jgi:glutamate-1-semialdehyde 2,1-aminomutase